MTEWQYSDVRPMLAAAADLLVWIDVPDPVTLSRVIRRTVRRRLRREELWNGNIEPPLHTFVTDRDHIVRWSWRTRKKLDTRVPETLAAHPHLVGVHLRTRAEVEAWIRALEHPTGGPFGAASGAAG